MALAVKKTLKLLVILPILFLASCEKDLYEEPIHKSRASKITLEQFKNETGVEELNTTISLNMNAGVNSKNVEEEYYIKTNEILKLISDDGKTTYTLKILPIEEEILPNEFYNLVYEKYNEELNVLIFKNKLKDNPQPGESKMESSKMIYNQKHQSIMQMQGFCEVITYTIHCDGSCAHEGYSECDGFACPTGECIHMSVSWDYCGGSTSGSGEGDGGFNGGLGNGTSGPGTGPGSGPGGQSGGTSYQGIYIPLPYSGTEDLNNADFILTCQTAAFIKTLPYNINSNISYNMRCFIIDYFRQNGGITDANKIKVIQALTNYSLMNHQLPSSWLTTRITEFNLWAFTYFLQNPNPASLVFVNNIHTRIMQDPNIYKSYKPFLIEKLIDASDLNPCSQGVVENIKTIQQDDIAKILAKLGDVSSVYKVTIIKEDLPEDVLGSTDWSTPIGSLVVPFDYTVKLDTQFLQQGTKLGIAATIIHEMIHAYFLSLIDDYERLDDPAINTFPALWNNYVTSLTGEGADLAEHIQMANSYVDAIARALQEYQTGVKVPDNEQPQQIYKDLAWGGLGETPAYNALSTEEKNRIIAVNNAENYNTPETANGNNYAPVSTPCN